MATCMSPVHATAGLGELLAQGKTTEEAVAELGQVAEGAKTAPTVLELANEFNVAMPIAETASPASSRAR